MKYRCLLFDLDGTLVDSRADITDSLNLTLAEMGRTALPAETVHGFIGEGVRLLIERALRATQTSEPSTNEVDSAWQIYQRQYRAHMLDQTQLYPGVAETLEALQAWPKAVVTNKPYEFTAELLEGVGLLKHFAVVLGGNSLPERKPSPLMLLEAARLCETVPVGSSRVDLQACKLEYSIVSPK